MNPGSLWPREASSRNLAQDFFLITNQKKDFPHPNAQKLYSSLFSSFVFNSHFTVHLQCRISTVIFFLLVRYKIIRVPTQGLNDDLLILKFVLSGVRSVYVSDASLHGNDTRRHALLAGVDATRYVRFFFNLSKMSNIVVSDNCSVRYLKYANYRG